MLGECATQCEEKARYCKRCCDYLPIAEFSETDTVHTDICKRHDDLRAKTVRWCKTCNDFVCLSLFRKGVVEFLCKKHMYDQRGRKAMANVRNKPENIGFMSIRNICYVDMKTFKQNSIGLKREEIEMVTNSIIKSELIKFALLPIDPSKQMSIDNVVLVSREKRVNMMKIFKDNRHEEYEKIANEEKRRMSV